MKPTVSLHLLVVSAILHGGHSHSAAADENDAGVQAPLVYAVEHTRSSFPAPPLPALQDLRSVAPFPDPLGWSDGSGRVTRFDEWSNMEGIETVTLKAETATVGSNWQIGKDDDASNGGYASANDGVESVSDAPADNEGLINLPFSLNTDERYAVFARLNCSSLDDNPFWARWTMESLKLTTV